MHKLYSLFTRRDMDYTVITNYRSENYKKNYNALTFREKNSNKYMCVCNFCP